MQIFTSELDTPLGRIYLASARRGLVLIGLSTLDKFTRILRRRFPMSVLIQDDNPNQAAIDQLNAYFAGKRRSFSLPLVFDGSDFQIRVWKALLDIPYGRTVTYKDLAVLIGKPKAFRAVGNANNRNPLGIIVPCHRVIGANGKLIGYGGGLGMKEKLLQLEGAILT